MLAELNLDVSVTREHYESELKRLQKNLAELSLKAYNKKKGLIVVFEGMDAAGKGGSIRRIARALDPEIYHVIPFAAPTPEEKERHYLWRFHRKIPDAGHIAIFDRSWYGRVLVERVEGFATSEEWSRAYEEILGMERAFSNSGWAVVKFWLQISQDEQINRFKSREESPLKNWKLTPEDWRNREKWPLYVEAIEEMILKTSVSYAPWHLIEANDKLFARLKVLRLTVEALANNIG